MNETKRNCAFWFWTESVDILNKPADLCNSISIEAITFQCHSSGKCRLNVKKWSAKNNMRSTFYLWRIQNKLTHHTPRYGYSTFAHILHGNFILFVRFFFFFSFERSKSAERFQSNWIGNFCAKYTWK